MKEVVVWDILPSQRLKFNGSDLGVKVQFAEEEKLGTWRKTLGIRLGLTNLSPHVEPRTRSQVVEVGSATDDHYASLTTIKGA